MGEGAVADALREDFSESPVDAGHGGMDLVEFRFGFVIEAGAGDDDLQGVADVMVHLLDDGGALPLTAKFALLLPLEEEDQDGGDQTEEEVVEAGGFGVETDGGEPAIHQIDGDAHGEAGQHSDGETAPRHFFFLLAETGPAVGWTRMGATGVDRFIVINPDPAKGLLPSRIGLV
jgi:hypothetical protein